MLEGPSLFMLLLALGLATATPGAPPPALPPANTPSTTLCDLDALAGGITCGERLHWMLQRGGSDRGLNLETVGAAVAEALKNLQFGAVEITLHNGQVVQIERKEKFRFQSATR